MNQSTQNRRVNRVAAEVLSQVKPGILKLIRNKIESLVKKMGQNGRGQVNEYQLTQMLELRAC